MLVTIAVIGAFWLGWEAGAEHSDRSWVRVLMRETKKLEGFKE